MDGWHEGVIEANGLPLHYIRTGSGDQPALLLLHGLTDNGRYWSRTAAALQDRFDVIMLDQRGHGQSARPSGGYSAENMADDAAGVVHALRLAPVTVLGHSMGGSVAIALAAAYRDLVTRLLLLDPALRLSADEEDSGEQRRQRMDEWRRATLANQQRSLTELERRCIAQHPAWSSEDCHYWAESNLQVYPDAIPLFQVQQAWPDLILRISCPVLLIYGDSDLGSIVDEDLAAEAARLAPNVTAVHIAGAGHSAHREQFDLYIAAVRAFLN
jgi:pimeloyl-ACP methyl ester carboxylesterase